MIRSFAVAVFALTIATSSQAMSPVPLHHADGITTQVAFFCGPGRTLSDVHFGSTCRTSTTEEGIQQCMTPIA